jgi:hypothetical protein
MPPSTMFKERNIFACATSQRQPGTLAAAESPSTGESTFATNIVERESWVRTNGHSHPMRDRIVKP